MVSATSHLSVLLVTSSIDAGLYLVGFRDPGILCRHGLRSARPR
jgi:hypothetical protein